MAARMPYFVWSHAGRAAGDASVTMSPAASSTMPKYRSLDGFGQSLAQHGSSSASAYWQVDRGAGTLEAVDRLLIPSGHNLGAQTVAVKASATGAYAGEETTLASFTSAAGLIEQAVTSSTARYLRVSFGGTGQWEYGEMWLGRTRTPSSAVVVDPGWKRPPLSNVTVQRFPTGVQGSVVNGPDQRTLGMTLRWVAGSDLTLFEDLATACGAAKAPFWVGGPDDATPTMLAWLSAISAWEQDSEVPQATGPTYTVQLELVEALG